jgi:hypothetical protein
MIGKIAVNNMRKKSIGVLYTMQTIYERALFKAKKYYIIYLWKQTALIQNRSSRTKMSIKKSLTAKKGLFQETAAALSHAITSYYTADMT